MSRLLLLFLLAWGLGFSAFIEHVRGLDVEKIETAGEVVDAIVVPTGGSERIDKGVELLRSGKGNVLFISGVHRGAKMDQFLKGATLDKNLRDCCVALGYEAETTIGNARETRDWMAQQGYSSLRLVTANYHLPRALMLFSAAMPEVKIIPHPVTPDTVVLEDWWNHAGTASLLATEYTKLIGAWLNLKAQSL